MTVEAHTTSDQTRDEVFEQEQEHLTRIYRELQSEHKLLETSMKQAHEQAKRDLAALSSEVRTNLGSDDEEMESYAAIEGLNQLIDAYNQKHDFDADRQKRIDVLLMQPYFAKVVLKMREGRPPREVYIGSVGITDRTRAPMIIDWRSPIAQTYYDQHMGRTSYCVNGKQKEVELLLRRQFDITRSKLKSYFDSDIAIQDSLLLHVLNQEHSEKLKAITATIQREQNEIIRHADVQAMLIEGIAGSGKTSVMLQRIAYLLYQQRDTLSAQEIGLFAPNSIFEHYINMVLPSLGEENPKTYTWKRFITEEGLAQYGEGRSTTLEDLGAIRANMQKISLLPGDLCVLAKDDQVLIKVSSIQQALEKFSHIPPSPKLITLLKDELHARLDKRIAQLARSEALQDEMLNLDIEQQMQIFGEIPTTQHEDDVMRYAKIYARALYGSVHKDIDDERWIMFPNITKRLVNKENPSSVEVLYLHALMSSYEPHPFKYIAIDEAQDVTAAQIECLIACFPRAHFLMLGDNHQAIRNHASSFDDMEAIFKHAGKELVRAQLRTSFRSTPEITNLFWSLFKDEENECHVAMQSVQQAGNKPTFYSAREDAPQEYLSCLLYTSPSPRD